MIVQLCNPNKNVTFKTVHNRIMHGNVGNVDNVGNAANVAINNVEAI